MAKNEPNKPDEMKNVPENEAPVKEQIVPIEAAKIADKAPAPETSTGEAATTAPKDQAASKGIGEAKAGPPPPASGERIPTPGDIVVSFDKIKEMVSEKQAARKETEKSDPATETAQSNKTGPKAGENRQGRAKPLQEIGQNNKPETSRSKSAETAVKKPAGPAKQEKASRVVKTDKPDKQKQVAGRGRGRSVSAKSTEQAQQSAPSSELPPEPSEAPRSGKQEQIVYLNLSELHSFKDHPFQVRNDEEMAAMVGSVKDKGVTQPAIVRPREDGGYEIVSGHRRQKASELAGFADMPCIIRNLTDEQAITQMVEDNTNQREHILPSERARALHMQLEAIKRQGVRTGNGQRSNEVVAERNKMTVKQVQRYIKLNELVPDLMKMVDEKKIAFTPAVELAFIKPKNQNYIAIAIEGQQSSPSLSQAQRMRDLDQKKLLNPDVIDGIMLEEKKEVDKVIISSQELSQYFGKDKTPREMKDTIIKLLDEWKDKQPELSKPEKKTDKEK
ncbi:ParB/RepB/Spo0J family partition protein [Brevibacillus sp. B_LB10_24]|uniref:ParB/RepB/Spo0J family partition protein n=1 Tax=Brevibacillus sp. B_LB10_24 TaxID=3380645 RepID=UPI0038B9DA95